MEKKSKLLEYVEENIYYIDVQQALSDALIEVLQDAENDKIKLKNFTKKERKQIVEILKECLFSRTYDYEFYGAIDDAEDYLGY